MGKIFYKTDEEIELIRESSLLVGKTLAEVAKLVEPGVIPLALDKIAEEFIRDNKAVPGFKDYNGFPNTLCISTNAAVVHGIPNNKPLQNGDIISVDCGTILNGFYGDVAYTFEVGEVKPEIKKLLSVTKECHPLVLVSIRDLMNLDYANNTVNVCACQLFFQIPLHTIFFSMRYVYFFHCCMHANHILLLPLLLL